jgi:hypothetical protein
VARYFRRDLEEKPTCEQFVARVYSRGGTLPDGSYTVSKPGKVEVDLNDGRVFVFSLASIWKDAKLRNSQMTLAP